MYRLTETHPQLGNNSVADEGAPWREEMSAYFEKKNEKGGGGDGFLNSRWQRRR